MTEENTNELKKTTIGKSKGKIKKNVYKNQKKNPQWYL